MGRAVIEARHVYDRLWRHSIAALRAGRLRFDTNLRKPKKDPRRGVTLVGRLDPSVRKRVKWFLREAAALCPDQYFYQPSEWHMTILAVIPGSESWRKQIHRLPLCRELVAGVLENRPAFSVSFRGVTVSPEAVLIQGFPRDNSLTRLRDDLRQALRAGGADEDMDKRYKIAAAHLTVMRFSNPNEDWQRLADFLRAHRNLDFGETRFHSLQLIWSNWYASAGVVRTLDEYPLKD